MIVDYHKALEAYLSLPVSLQAATLSPKYVVADATKDKTLKPLFWLSETDGDLFFYGFHKARINDSNYYDIQSPYGYGGPLATSENEKFNTKAWDSYCQWCKSENVITRTGRKVTFSKMNDYVYF